MASNNTTKVIATIDNMSQSEKLNLILKVTTLNPDEDLEARITGTLAGILDGASSRKEKKELTALILAKLRKSGEATLAAIELVEMKFREHSTGGRSQKSKRRKRTKRR